MVYTCDLATHSYDEASTLRPGQGGWAYAAWGGTAALVPVPPVNEPTVEAGHVSHTGVYRMP